MLTTSRFDNSTIAASEPRSSHMRPARPHQLEQEVQRRLMADPGLRFSSLVIRRIDDGVCLQGVLEASDDADVSSIARRVAGVDRVLNYLVDRTRA